MDSFLQKVSTEVDHKPTNIVIVTDGQLPLRQCLLPETCSKGINDPPAVFGIFYDLRKEFRKGFPNAPEINSIQDMINCKFLFLYFFFFSLCSRLKCLWVFLIMWSLVTMFFFQVQGQIYIEFFSTHRQVFFRECHATQCVWGRDVFFFFFWESHRMKVEKRVIKGSRCGCHTRRVWHVAWRRFCEVTSMHEIPVFVFQH